MAIKINFDPDAKGSIDRPTGVLQAVLSNVHDLGEGPDPFHEGKTKHQIVLEWQLRETYTTTKGEELPIRMHEICNLSLNEKANLRRYVDGMLGKALPKGEFDLESLIGTQCMLTVKKRDKSDYTEVEATAPLMKGLPRMAITQLPIPEWITKWQGGERTDPSSEFAKDQMAVVGKDKLQDALDAV